MSASSLVAPHGGVLINRIVDAATALKLKAEAASLPTIVLSAKQACDLEMIAIGAFSPLQGFVGQDDFVAICKTTRFSTTRSARGLTGDGLPWSIPITLAVNDAVKASVKVGGRAALKHSDGTLMAIIDVKEIYAHDKKLEIPAVFGTEDPKHPGVEAVLAEGDWCIGGPIHVLTVTPEKEPGEQFTEYRLSPAQTRAEFEKRGWKTIAAFQTRNPCLLYTSDAADE